MNLSAARNSSRSSREKRRRAREGRLILTFGNGVNGDCTLESLSAFMEEAYGYGSEKIRNKR